jgi:subtilisin family serine protease
MMGKAAVIALAMTVSTAALAAGPAAKDAGAAGFKAAQSEAKSGDMAKMGPVLRALYKAQRNSSPASAARSALTTPKIDRLQRLLHATDGYVTVDIALTGDAAAARAAFESYGLTNVSTYENHLSGRVPVAALATVSRNASVVAVRPVLSKTRVGLTTTQGDKAQRSDDVRKAFGLSGAGVKVGVLSDSFDCRHTPLTGDPDANFTTATEDVANNDLPTVQVLKDLPEPDCSESGTDEGRAILQLLHDVAPASPLAFYTASVSQTDFAAGIKALADAGAQVIVDDVIYFAEPMFQDGIIAQAVDSVKARGVTYFSSAGNDERQSYEAGFKRSQDEGLSGLRHNFGTTKAPDTLQLTTLDPAALTLFTFQWDEPFASVSGAPGSRSDVDVIFYDTDGNLVPLCDDNLEPAICQIPGIDANPGGDPIEIAVISNATDSSVDVNISIELFSGPAPGRMKYVWFDLGDGLFHLAEFNTDSGTAYGHANAAGAEAVGAAPWYNTAEFGSPLWGNKCKPACLEYFSSAGGVPILFDKKGKRLPFPQIRLKPGVTGPDGGNTSFFFARTTDPRVGGGEPDQFPNFFGTSASAPHVAGIAALMIEQMRRNGQGRGGIDIPTKLRPDFIFTTLRATASDMKWRAARTIAPYAIERPNGFDFDSGFGYVDALKALTVVRTLRVSTD